MIDPREQEERDYNNRDWYSKDEELEEMENEQEWWEFQTRIKIFSGDKDGKDKN